MSCDDCQEAQDASPKKEWWLSTSVFSPTDIGSPSVRRRKYTLGYWLPRMRPQSHLEEDLAAGNKFFQRRFFRPLRCDASIYLDADASRPLIGVPSSHQGGPEGGAVFPDGLGKLTPAAAARLEGHQLCAHAAGFCDASFHDWTIPFALADVTQNVEFRRMSGTLHMPTLLKKTKLWDMVRDVPVHPVSIVCAQGFPCAARGVPSELA